MKQGRFFVFIVSFILFGGLFLTPYTSVFANNQQNNSNQNQNYHGNNNNNHNNYDNNKNDHNKNDDHNKKHDNDHGKNNDDFCKDHPNDYKCQQTISVPEFGVIPGVVATILSAGSFLALKKRKI